VLGYEHTIVYSAIDYSRGTRVTRVNVAEYRQHRRGFVSRSKVAIYVCDHQAVEALVTAPIALAVSYPPTNLLALLACSPHNRKQKTVFEWVNPEAPAPHGSDAPDGYES
jgi:hypothetical protein